MCDVCDVTIWGHIHVYKLTFWPSLLTQNAYNSTHTLLTRCCTKRHCNEHKLSALQGRRPEQNTALNAKTEQFITAKLSGIALNRGVEHTHCCASAFHKCKNIRLRKCLVENQTSREGMRLGWRTPRVDSLKLAKVHKNWACAWRTQENFRFILCGCYIYNYFGARTDTDGIVWTVMINPPDLPINDEARIDAHIASTGVRLY